MFELYFELCIKRRRGRGSASLIVCLSSSSSNQQAQKSRIFVVVGQTISSVHCSEQWVHDIINYCVRVERTVMEGLIWKLLADWMMMNVQWNDAITNYNIWKDGEKRRGQVRARRRRNSMTASAKRGWSRPNLVCSCDEGRIEGRTIIIEAQLSTMASSSSSLFHQLCYDRLLVPPKRDE